MPARDVTAIAARSGRPRRWCAGTDQRARHAARGSSEPSTPGDAGFPGAQTDLAALATDQSQPAIARALALSLLPEYLSEASMPAVGAALADTDPLVRATVIAALESVPGAERARLGAPGLRDPVRAVRLAAAHALADVPRQSLTAEQQTDLDRGLAELVASEKVDADRPEARVNLANLYAGLGRAGDAEAELRNARFLDARFLPALLNLADLFRAKGREADAQRFLEQALEVAPDNAEALHALGLLRVRQGRRTGRWTCCAARLRAGRSRSASPTCARWRCAMPAIGRGRPRCSRRPTAGGRRTATSWSRW